jgi:NAD(P)-dependent dehydrogenase (short-subunit alcohol dehydrogenase family)
MMLSFPDLYRVCVIGATGAIGAAFVAQLRSDPRCALVVDLHRHSVPPIDYANEATVSAAAESVRHLGPFHLIIHAAGILHTEDFMPEKKLDDVNFAQMQTTFLINTFGPALALRHFSALLDRDRGVFALLSAKVGSIEDNRLGGWYSYRASKAALNMLIKTAAIEIKRKQPNSIIIALHPGTVNSTLSRPFRGEQIGRSAALAASEMLTTIDRLLVSDTACFFSYDAEQLPW